MYTGTIDEEDMLSIIDGFSDAALDNSQWDRALHRFAAASGSQLGQLVGFSADGPHFNWMGGVEPGWQEELTRLGGSDPAGNPRLAAGLSYPILRLVSDQDIVTPSERRHHPFYASVLPRMGMPYFCATVLFREPGLTVGLAVGRTKGQGEISDAQRRTFQFLAHHARAAVRTQLLLEEEGSKLIAGALEAVAVAAFLCDQRGQVRALTPAAEALVGRGQPLSLQQGVLKAGTAAQARQLAAAIERAAVALSGVAAPASTTLVLHGEGESRAIVDISALPVDIGNFRFRPRVLVTVRGQGARPPDQGLLLRSLFGLSQTEAAVASALGRGDSQEEIAQARHRSLETVRVQVRSIYRKLGVRRQAELVALLGQLR